MCVYLYVRVNFSGLFLQAGLRTKVSRFFSKVVNERFPDFHKQAFNTSLLLKYQVYFIVLAAVVLVVVVDDNESHLIFPARGHTGGAPGPRQA